MFVCSHPHDKHPSQAGFCFAGPYQTVLEPGSSSTPSFLLFYPRIFGSGSCLCSAKQFTLESRWSEIFQAETHLDQAANNETIIDPPARMEPPPGSWKEAAALDKGWCIPCWCCRGYGTKGPPRGVVCSNSPHVNLGILKENLNWWGNLPWETCPSLVGIYHTEHGSASKGITKGLSPGCRSADWAAVGCLRLVFSRLLSDAHKNSLHGVGGACEWDFRGRCTISHKLTAVREVTWKEHWDVHTYSRVSDNPRQGIWGLRPWVAKRLRQGSEETQNPELQKLITYRASKAKLPQVALQGPPA